MSFGIWLAEALISASAVSITHPSPTKAKGTANRYTATSPPGHPISLPEMSSAGSLLCAPLPTSFSSPAQLTRYCTRSPPQFNLHPPPLFFLTSSSHTATSSPGHPISLPEMSATDLPVFVAASRSGLPEEASTLAGLCAGGPGRNHRDRRGGLSCRGLAEVTLPPGLTHIGENAFHGCGGLAEVTLPPGRTHIGDDAFKYCGGAGRAHPSTRPHPHRT